MLTLKIGICDNDRVFCNDIEVKLNNYIIYNDINISYRIYYSGEKLLQNYTKAGTFNILFLKIEMPKMNGMTLAEYIKNKIDRNIIVILISNYSKYMQDSFRIHPFYYLVKPISTNLFNKIMTDIIATIENEYILFTLLDDNKTKKIVNICDVRYIDVYNSKKEILCFHFFNYNTLTKGKITNWTSKLSDYNFFLCHRSILVNMIHIHYFEPGNATLDNEEKIPLSRRQEKKLIKLYSNSIVKLKNI